MTLLLNGIYLEIDATFSYPLSLTSDGGAWSTDFEVPATHDALAAFGLGSFLCQPWPSVVSGLLYTGGGDAYPCKVYLRGYHNDTITAYITMQVLPAATEGRVTDIARLAGSDILFNYPRTSHRADDADIEWLPYLNGRGSTAADGIMPCVAARSLLQRLSAWAGLPIDLTNIPGDLYLVPNTIYPSPRVNTLRISYNSATSAPTTYISPTTFATPRRGYAYSAFLCTLTMQVSGTLTSIEYSGTPYSETAIWVKLNSSTIFSTTTTSDARQSMPDITFNFGDVITLHAEARNPFSHAITFYFGGTFANFNIRPRYALDEPWKAWAINPTPDSTEPWCRTGVAACITATMAQLLSDIAAMSGTVVQYRQGAISFQSSRPQELQRYTIDGYTFDDDSLAANNYAVYANDSDEEPHRDLLRQYSGDGVAEDKTLITMAADGSTLDENSTPPMARYDNYVGGALAWGHGYWLAVKDGAGNLVPAVASSPLLPPSGSYPVAVEATVYEDVSNAIHVIMEGREWVLTGREVQDDGTTKIDALLI